MLCSATSVLAHNPGLTAIVRRLWWPVPLASINVPRLTARNQRESNIVKDAKGLQHAVPIVPIPDHPSARSNAASAANVTA